MVSQGTAQAGEAPTLGAEGRSLNTPSYSTFRIIDAMDGSTAAAGRIKSGTGVVGFITVGIAGDASSTITLYDATTVTGTAVWVISAAVKGWYPIYRGMAIGTTIVSVDAGATLEAIITYL